MIVKQVKFCAKCGYQTPCDYYYNSNIIINNYLNCGDKLIEDE